MDDRSAGLARLMERYADGDPLAFDRIFRRLRPRLRGYLRGRVPPDEVEDLVQDVFLRAHRSLHRFEIGRVADPDAGVTAWYLTIARHAAVDLHRKHGRDPLSRRRSPATTTEVQDLPVERLVAVAPTPEERAIAVEIATAASARLLGALEQLPPNQRHAVRLHQLKGLSMAEVAKRSGATVGATRVRAHRGYAKLRALLEVARASTQVAISLGEQSLGGPAPSPS